MSKADVKIDDGNCFSELSFTGDVFNALCTQRGGRRERGDFILRWRDHQPTSKYLVLKAGNDDIWQQDGRRRGGNLLRRRRGIDHDRLILDSRHDRSTSKLYNGRRLRLERAVYKPNPPILGLRPL